MPIYEYQCTDCKFRYEKIQKISDPALTECPSCHGQGLEKLVSATAFRLKGSGWYETDFKSDNKKNLTSDQGKNGGSESDSGQSGDGKKTEVPTPTKSEGDKKTTASPAESGSD